MQWGFQNWFPLWGWSFRFVLGCFASIDTGELSVCMKYWLYSSGTHYLCTQLIHRMDWSHRIVAVLLVLHSTWWDKQKQYHWQFWKKSNIYTWTAVLHVSMFVVRVLCLSSVVFLKHGSGSFSFFLAGWMQSSKFLDSGRIHSRANVSCQSVTSFFYFLFWKRKRENDANCVMALPWLRFFLGFSHTGGFCQKNSSVLFGMHDVPQSENAHGANKTVQNVHTRCHNAITVWIRTMSSFQKVSKRHSVLKYSQESNRESP